MPTPRKPASGEEPRPRKPAARKPAAAKAPAKPRAPRKAKPAGEAPAKPRASKKKALDNADQLALDLASAPPVEAKKPARARKPAAPKETAPVKPAVKPAPKAAPRAAAPRPAPTPAVRVTMPKKVRARDLWSALPSLPRRAEPVGPMPLHERMLGWLRNAATIAVVVLSLLVMWGAMYALVNPDHTPLMTMRYWQGLDQGRALHTWKPFEELGDTTLLAIVAATDPGFLDPGGLSPNAMKAAVTEGETESLKATSLGRQTAQLMFSWPSDSLLPRASTALFTLVFEVSWSKRRILEVYANLAELGPGIYGAEAAAQHYFAKPATQLNENEVAWLAAMLAHPLGPTPQQPDPALEERAQQVLATMQQLGGPARIREALPAPKAEKI